MSVPVEDQLNEVWQHIDHLQSLLERQQEEVRDIRVSLSLFMQMQARIRELEGEKDNG